VLNLHISQTSLYAGERLSGRITWVGKATRPQTLMLTIAWRTEGRGTVDVDTLHEASLPLEGGAFSYAIPPKGPYSYDGELIRVIWEVIAIANMGGFSSKPQKITKVFRVVPRGYDLD
jgi:hypothetical protein